MNISNIRTFFNLLKSIWNIPGITKQSKALLYIYNPYSIGKAQRLGVTCGEWEKRLREGRYLTDHGFNAIKYCIFCGVDRRSFQLLRQALSLTRVSPFPDRVLEQKLTLFQVAVEPWEWKKTVVEYSIIFCVDDSIMRLLTFFTFWSLLSWSAM